MTGRIFTVALLAGLLAGLVISVVQEFTTTPIILHAEEFESKGGHAQLNLRERGVQLPAGHENYFHLAHSDKQGSGTGDDRHEAWAPEDGLERTLFTAMANVLTAVGYALLLVAVMVLRGQPISARIGIVWGIAGFCVVTLAPSLGLPPEVPGAMAADVPSRQLWWAATAVATAAALWLMVFGTKKWMPILGLVLLVLPHAIGAPTPPEMGGPVPPELAAHFVSASLVTAAVFWAVLGWLVGYLGQRFRLIPGT